MRQVNAWTGFQTEKSKWESDWGEHMPSELSSFHCNSDFIRILFMRAEQVTTDTRRAYFWIPFSKSRWGTCVNTAGESLEQRWEQRVCTVMMCHMEKPECLWPRTNVQGSTDMSCKHWEFKSGFHSDFKQNLTIGDSRFWNSIFKQSFINFIIIILLLLYSAVLLLFHCAMLIFLFSAHLNSLFWGKTNNGFDRV